VAARLDEPALRQRRRELRALEEGVPDGTGDRFIDVLADQIGQLERPHPETAALAQHRVDGGGVGATLLVDGERLRVEGACDAVDDEAGGVGAAHGGLAPGGDGGQGPFGRRLVRRVAADDLDEGEEGRRIEEVQADEAARAAQRAGDRRDGEGGGVGGEKAVVGDGLLQRREQLLLDRELFQDGLDDECRVGELRDVRGGEQPATCGVALRGRHPPLLDEPVQASADRLRGLLGPAGNGVVETYGMACDQGHLRDSLAHGSGADDGDGAARADRGRGVDGGHGGDPPR
jgi:hypothetical protein